MVTTMAFLRPILRGILRRGFTTTVSSARPTRAFRANGKTKYGCGPVSVWKRPVVFGKCPVMAIVSFIPLACAYNTPTTGRIGTCPNPGV